MGAGATTFAYGMEDGLKTRDITAMVAVQPLTYSKFLKAFGMPGILEKASTEVSNERIGRDMNAIDYSAFVQNINAPTLVIQNENDPWTDMDFVRNFHESLNVEKKLMMVALAKERAAAYAFLGEEPQHIAEWFDKFVAPEKQ